ncbi:MAG: hypothetical protein HZB16_13525 [Armatimonadetes bacterium]|nr:hypothetical protein [Armatimonadota bacterium]
MPDTPPAVKLSGLRLRALLVGVPLVVFMSLVTVYGDMVVGSVQIGILQFAPAAVGGLLVLVALSRLVRWALRINLLASGDLFPIYVMMLIAVLMGSRGTIEKLVPPLVHLNYIATAENKYMELFADFTPQHLVVYDPHGAPLQRITRDYYEGNARVQWRRWVGPILSWSGLLGLLYCAFFCLSVILRKQWADSEKLVFPLVALPLIILDDDQAKPFFANRLTWVGAAIPAAVILINGLHANIPGVPELKLRWVLNDYFTTRPWNGIFYTPVNLSFAAIGFFYFLSSDLLLSLWLFFAITRMTDVAAVQLGFQPTVMPQYPTRLYIGYQVAGAYLVLVVYLIHSGWGHYKPVLRSALSRARSYLADGPDDEMIPFRLAVWGLLLSFVGAVLWCIAAGLDPWLAVTELGVFVFIVALVLTRGTAEAGLLQTEASFRPIDLIKMFRPQWSLGSRNLVMMAMLDTVLTRDMRGLLLSTFMDNQKLARELRYRPRALVLPIALAIVVALVAGCYFFITTSHQMGHITLYGYPRVNAEWQLKEAAGAMEARLPMPPGAGLAFGAGVVVCAALVVLRTTLVWWPLHPLAYAVSASWTLVVFWFPALVTWVIKGFILRSGGMKLYRRCMPFFLGLILGTFASAFFWTALVLVGRFLGYMPQAPAMGFD